MRTYQHTLKQFLVLGTVLVTAFAFTACETFVEDVDQPVDEAGADQFSDPAEAEFLITGIEAQWASTHTTVTGPADFLSDEFRFGLNGDATFPTFRELDSGDIEADNNSIQGALNALGEYRFLADDLLRRVEEDDQFDLDDPSATASEEEARFAANLHGANARYYYATFFGDPDNPRRGGAPIDTSEFIPSPELYQEADDKYGEALEEAIAMGDEELQRQVQSARARAALYAGTHDFEDTGGLQGDEALEAAAEYAQEGLEAEESWDVLHDLSIGNDYHFDAGAGRIQMAVQDGNLAQLRDGPNAAYRVADEETGELVARSHIETIAENPDELNRIPLTIVDGVGTTLGGFGALAPGLAGLDLGPEAFAAIFDEWQPDGEENEIAALDGAEMIEWGQGRWAEETDTPFISWQEVYLIRAELELRGYDAGDEEPLELVNEVRASFDLEDLEDIDMERLAIERDRTLFATGNRLPDQRRLADVEWHLQDEIGGEPTWQWLRLEQSETTANPNF